MKLRGSGFLITYVEVPDELDDDLNQWYQDEHLDERINLPGFRRARRYEAIRAEIRYMTTYESITPDAIGSPEYLRKLATPTEWSKRLQQRFSKAHRLMGRVVVDRAKGLGAYVATIRFTQNPSRERALAEWFQTEGLLPARDTPGITGWYVVNVDANADRRMRRGLGLEEPNDTGQEWALIVEGCAIDPTMRVAQQVRDQLREEVKLDPVLETYRFMYGNSRLSEEDTA